MDLTDPIPPTVRAADLAESRIGIFDSGVGGLSILKALLALRPDLNVDYIADSGHAPYGDRDAVHVASRSTRIVDHLIEQGADLIVVACNTATALAIDALRRRHPRVRMVGVEPGIKPAAEASRARRIGVLATPATVASPRFAALVERHAGACEVHAIACPGLAAAIERGPADASAEIAILLDRYAEPLLRAEVDTVVLGCTHYAFIADQIALRLGPTVQIIDTAGAVARHALAGSAGGTAHASKRHDGRRMQPRQQTRQQLRLQSTGETSMLAHLAAGELGWAGTVGGLDL